MNVMAQAHKNTKLFFKVQPLSSFTYAQVFRDYLKQSHKEYKTMQATNTLAASNIQSTCEADADAFDFTVKGTATSEGERVYIGYTTGSELAAQNEAVYYHSIYNGYTDVDLVLVMHYHGKPDKWFKIVK